MEKLQTIQKLSKAGKILSKICFILCLIGIGFSIAGIICLALGADTIRIDGITLERLIKRYSNITADTYMVVLVGYVIVGIGEAVLAKFAEHYFKRELEDGTPFTYGGAKELKRLGILTICIPLGTSLISSIIQAIMTVVLPGAKEVPFDASISLSLGITFIIVSLLCTYGAHLREEAEHKNSVLEENNE